MKVLVVVAAILVLLIGIPIKYVDSIAEGALEEGATATFGTKTTVGDFNMGLLSGAVGIDDLRVRNPEGWGAKYFFEIGDGRFAVSWRQFLEDQVEVPELIVENVNLSLEKRGSKSNYGDILDYMAKTPAPPPDPDAKRFVIRDVRIRNVKADLKLEAAAGIVGKDLEVLIPEIRLRNIGSDTTGGAVSSQVWSTVMRAVLAAVVREGGGVAGFITRDLGGNLAKVGGVPFQVIGDVTRTGADVAAGVGQAAGDALGKATGGAVDAGSALGGAAGDAVKKGLGGLLGGGDED